MKASIKKDKAVGCKTCKGKGYVVVQTEYECSTCGGSGLVLGKRCSTCKGTGKMYIPEEVPCPDCQK